MSLQKAFSVGRFRCAGTSPMISVAEYLNEGYALMVKKEGSTKKFCLNCVKAVAGNKNLQVKENENFLTIY